MSGEPPDRPPAASLIGALNVPRNLTIGSVVGIVLAVGAYLIRVLELLGPVAVRREYPILGPEGFFFVLALVLATGTAMLVATVLTLVSAIRLVRRI